MTHLLWLAKAEGDKSPPLLANWSGNLQFTAEERVYPESVEELQDIVKNAAGQVKVVGTRHCFNDIADTPGTQVSLAKFTKISVDEEALTATFGAGVTYTMLLGALHSWDMALPNLPSLPHLNVVGSVMTGTHGGGIGTQAVAAWVVGMRLVDPNGDIQVLTREDTEDFEHYLHSFGALGIITEMTMTVEPDYAVAKCIYEGLSWEFLRDQATYNEIVKSHDFVSFFTDWKAPRMTSVWLGKRVAMDDADAPEFGASAEAVCAPTFHGATLVERIHPVPGRDSDPCVSSGIGTWRDKIYHFLPGKPPSSGGDEIQTEFFVRFEDFPIVAEKLYRIAPLFTDYI